MPRGTPPARPASLGDVAQVAVEDALHLLASQIKLVRLEAGADLRRGLAGGVRIALFLPPLVLGYAFAMVALAWWLGRYWGRPAALAAVAAVQILPAGIGLLRALGTLGRAAALAPSDADGERRTLAPVAQAPRLADD